MANLSASLSPALPGMAPVLPLVPGHGGPGPDHGPERGRAARRAQASSEPEGASGRSSTDHGRQAADLRKVPRAGHADADVEVDATAAQRSALKAGAALASETLLLMNVRGAVWSVAADGSSVSLVRARDHVVLATVPMGGVETVRHSDGRMLKCCRSAYTQPPEPTLSASA